MMRTRFMLLIAGLVVAGCSDKAATPLLGTLEWDRISVPAEASEPVLRWVAAEGDKVNAGDLLLELDPIRLQARLDQAEAEAARADAALTEALNGARTETLDRARASLASAQAAVVDGRRNYRRQAQLLRRGVVAIAARDSAQTALAQAEAGERAADAQLRELLAGTRVEQVNQAEATRATVRAARDSARLDLQRLRVLAPRAGRVDALPFKPGDQPPIGAAVASLLVGEAPYARVFVPAPRRAGLKPGDYFDVRVEGVDTPLPARLRSIRSEPSFTPYYALSGDDATRLVYRAELLLEGEAARDLPAGLPLRAEASAEHGGDDDN